MREQDDTSFGMVSTIRNAARFRLAERLTARIIRVFSGKGPCVSEKTPMQPRGDWPQQNPLPLLLLLVVVRLSPPHPNRFAYWVRECNTKAYI